MKIHSRGNVMNNMWIWLHQNTLHYFFNMTCNWKTHTHTSIHIYTHCNNRQEFLLVPCSKDISLHYHINNWITISFCEDTHRLRLFWYSSSVQLKKKKSAGIAATCCLLRGYQRPLSVHSVYLPSTKALNNGPTSFGSCNASTNIFSTFRIMAIFWWPLRG